PDVIAPQFADLVPEGVRLVHDEVRAIDVRAHTIELAGGRTLAFDVLVLSPGSVPAFHGVEGAQTEAVPFYSLEDAERLRIVLDTGAWARSGLPACVVGGGVVGVELAFALAERLARGGAATGPRAAGRSPVLVREAMDEILQREEPRMRRQVKKKLARMRIEVRTRVREYKAQPRGIAIRHAV